MKDETWSSLRFMGRMSAYSKGIEHRRRFGSLVTEARQDGATWAAISEAARKTVPTLKRYVADYESWKQVTP